MKICAKNNIQEESKRITGPYTIDDNFVTVYTDNTIYEISRKTGKWACVKVGEHSYAGQVVTQECYDERVAECHRTGTFTLRFD